MIDVRLDREIEVGAKARPRYATDITVTDGGYEFRNSRWAFPLYEFEFDLEPGAPGFDEDLQEVIDLFHAAGGTSDTFLFRHWRDYQGIDQLIGTGDGSTTVFQLYRVYTRGAITRRRRITRPVLGTISIRVNGSPVSATADYSTGLITLAAAPADGAEVRADFEFDVPVRFADDTLEVASLTDVLDQIATVTLQEVREGTAVSVSDGGDGGDGGGVSDALVSIDFQTGTYSINGESKTLAEVVEEFAPYGTYTSADVIAAVGLRATKTATGPAFSTSSPVLTSAAFAAATPGGTDAGVTAVIDYTLSANGLGFVQIGIEMTDDAYSTDWGAQSLFGDGGNQSALYDFDAVDSTLDLSGNGTHRMAVTLSAAGLSGSIDGAAVVTTAAPQANLVTRIGFLCFALVTTGGSGPMTCVIKKIEFLPVHPAADLPGLSA